MRIVKSGINNKPSGIRRVYCLQENYLLSIQFFYSGWGSPVVAPVRLNNIT